MSSNFDMPQLPESPTTNELNKFVKDYPEIYITEDDEIEKIVQLENYEERFYPDFRGEMLFFTDMEKLQAHNEQHQQEFIDECKEPELKLLVTRTWGNREHAINSKEWRKLRSDTLSKADYQCRFCSIRSDKYMVCDHIDGNASNNEIDNLGINCPICDLIRHSGRASSRKEIVLMISNLSQLEIVKFSQQYFIQNKKIPLPYQIDSDVQKIPDDVEFNLMIQNYSELCSTGTKIKGFFTTRAASTFSKIFND